jgi:hypothetical protein
VHPPNLSRAPVTVHAAATHRERPVNDKVEVYNRCLADGGTSNCLALVNFWRILSNLPLAIDAAGQDSYRASANFWAVSRAATTCYSPQASTRALTWSVYAMAISRDLGG